MSWAGPAFKSDDVVLPSAAVSHTMAATKDRRRRLIEISLSGRIGGSEATVKGTAAAQVTRAAKRALLATFLCSNVNGYIELTQRKITSRVYQEGLFYTITQIDTLW